MEKALRLDPESWEVNKEAARVQLRRGHVPEATFHFENAVGQMDSDVHAWARLVTCYRSLGKVEDQRLAAETAVAEAEKILARDPATARR